MNSADHETDYFDPFDSFLIPFALIFPFLFRCNMLI